MNNIWCKIVGGEDKENLLDVDQMRPKSPKKRIVRSSRSCKALSSLFGGSQKDLSTVRGSTDSTLQEATHYPTYDPDDPDHNPFTETSLTWPPKTRRRPWSPTKWSGTRDPDRHESSTPSKSKFGLQNIACSIRATANLFYRNGSDENSKSSPVKSVSSKKSVRFQSGFSVINGTDQSSPIPISTSSHHSPPFLNIDLSPHDLMGNELTDHEALGCTGRPPSCPFILPAGTSKNVLSINDELQQCLENIRENKQQAQSFISSTHMSPTSELENPFDDAAAIYSLEKNTSDAKELALYADSFRIRPPVMWGLHTSHEAGFASNDDNSVQHNYNSHVPQIRHDLQETKKP